MSSVEVKQQQQSSDNNKKDDIEMENTNKKKTDDEMPQQQQQAASTSASGATSNNTTSMSSPAIIDNSSSYLPTLPMSIAQFGLIAATAVVSTFVLIQNTSTHPEFFFITPTVLSAGQVMAFLVGFGVLATFVGIHFLIFKEYFDNNNNKYETVSGSGEIQKVSATSAFNLAIRRVTTEQHYNVIFAATEFTLCLFLLFVCDRTTLLERTGKKYQRDLFWFLCLVFLIAGLATLKKAVRPKPPRSAAADSSSTTTVVPVAGSEEEQMLDPVFHVAHLNRDQTEEWKGWMQVMFLWYHYFNAKEIYNAIRLFIAAYVWMTGFGNFSYYYMRKDFSLLRFAHMQWRLNFLCFWVCLLMQNEYMLYYICMLHTTFTVFIYIGLGIKSEMNQSVIGCWIKFGIFTAVAVFIWDVNGVFNYAWGLFKPLVQLHNPYKASQDLMFEWQFRSHLDHLVWIFGMICAFFHPNVETFLKKLDGLSFVPQMIGKSVVVGLALLATYMYYINVFSLDKKAYNDMHPYTSWIPIAIYIILRNISQVARQYHIHLFEFLGKITLETYISQYHIWLATTGINGSPKKLLSLVGGPDYPLINFAIFSGIGLFVSFKLFNSTNTMKSYFLPSSLQPEALRKVLISMSCVLAGLYAASYFIVMISGGMTAVIGNTNPPTSP